MHLRCAGGRQANRTAPVFGSMVQSSCTCVFVWSLFEEVGCHVPRTHWEADGRYSKVGADGEGRRGGSVAVLGYIEKAAEENPDSHMNTVTLDSVRSQMADAARQTGQLEASVQEVEKQVEGASGSLCGLADALDEINGIIWLVGVLNVKTKSLHVTGLFRGLQGSWKTVCG